MKREHVLKLREMIEKSAESLPDKDAVEVVELYPQWQAGVWYDVDDRRIRYETSLYRARTAHTSQVGWEPPNVPALWAEVEKPGEGDTPDNPIHYHNDMELVKDKYYEQFDVVYICTRDTGVPVYNNLADLVGIYVEVYRG